MRDVNRTILRGIVDGQPETRPADGGGAAVRFRMETRSMDPGGGRGGQREFVAWHAIVVDDDDAARVAETLGPDDAVAVEGALRTRREERDGVTLYFTEVVVHQVARLESAEPHLNRSLILGNVARTHPPRAFSWGRVMNVTVPTSERPPGADASFEDDVTEWHRVALFDDLVDEVEGRIAKGQRALVVGRVQTRKYRGRDGIERLSTETRASSAVVSGVRINRPDWSGDEEGYGR